MKKLLFSFLMLSFPFCYGQTIFIDHKVPQKNEQLLKITNATDKKDVNDTTITLTSCGEGWLNKDSLPTGKWKFYSKDVNGKEYLLKEGSFKTTTPDMFQITGMDTSEYYQKTGNSTHRLKVIQSTYTQYIKSGEWTYYHPNGTIWKKVNFKSDSLPILCEYVMDISSTDGSSGKYYVMANQNFGDDEYFGDSPVLEYGTDGHLYKKLLIGNGNLVNYKAYYDAKGKIIREVPYQGREVTIQPNNY